MLDMWIALFPYMMADYFQLAAEYDMRGGLSFNCYHFGRCP